MKPAKQKHDNLSIESWDLNPSDIQPKKKLENEINSISENLSNLQYKLFAESKKSLLVILQGVDASGKDGTIKHVMKALNPQNSYVKSFKIPNDEELSHDYLWRIHGSIPVKGQICIFNRSHYEDLTEPIINGLISRKILKQRYRQINDFERYLSENNIMIIKLFLYISKSEQKKRLLERIHDPNKQWKISEGDLIAHKKWEQYMTTYIDIFNHTNKKWAPWFIIPANIKYFRNWAVSKIILKALEDIKPEFPRLKLDPHVFKLD